jgi:hypothetical protein
MSYPQQGYGAPPQGGYGAPPPGYGPPQGGYGYGQHPSPYGPPQQQKEPADLGKIFGFSVLGLGLLIGLLHIVGVILSDFAPIYLGPTVAVEFAAALVVGFGLAARAAPKNTVVAAALSTSGAVTGLVSLILAFIAKLQPDFSSLILIILVFVLALIQAGLAAAIVFTDKGGDDGDVKTETPPSQTQASPYAGPLQPIGPQSYEQAPQHQSAPSPYAQAPAHQQQHGQASAPSPYASPQQVPQQAPSAPPQAPVAPPPAPASPYGIPSAGPGSAPPAPGGQSQINLGLGEPPRSH